MVEAFEGEETLLSGYTEYTDDSEDFYPLEHLNIVPEPASVFQLKRKAEKNPAMLDMSPEFQREYVWKSKQKSELVESILMGIPLPLFYVKERTDGVYVIIDGKQRLSTIFDFINGKFRISNKLHVLHGIEGKLFSELTALQQGKIEDYSLQLYVIKPPTSDRITYDLFDRVNRGGTQLNNQEMRNALYVGHSTRLLKELADGVFIDATDDSIGKNRMKDRYLVLRFIAFYLWRKKISIDCQTKSRLEYRSNMEDFLASTMEYLNHLDENDYLFEHIRNLFNNAMSKCKSVLGKDCFRLPSSGKASNRRPINMALFETITYYLVELLDCLPNKAIAIRNGYNELLSSNEFTLALTKSVDSKYQIYARFNQIEKKINEIKNA